MLLVNLHYMETIMDKRTIAAAAAALTASFSIATYAQDTTEIENAFSQCGIGASIFQNNETAAIISNVIWDLGTTALSSQTSSPGSCAGAKVKAAAFIYDTYPSIEEDVVKGEGDYISALLEITGCESGSQANVISSMQDDMVNELSSSDDRLGKSVKMGASLDRALTLCNA